MAKSKGTDKPAHEPIIKGTSIGDGRLKINSMNKHKRRSFKRYNRQGR